jgi:hypothetical protein
VLLNLGPSSNIAEVSNVKVQWTEHETLKDETLIIYQILVEKPARKTPLERSIISWKIIF